MQKYNLIISVKDITDESGITEPVTVDEVKNYIRLEGFIDVDESEATPFTEDDDLIEDLITSARERLEKELGISIVTKTLRATFTNLCGMIEIPYGPVISVTTLTDEDATEIDEDDYTLIGDDYQLLKSPCYENMQMTYEAGFTTVPKAIKQAILIEVAYRFINRGEELNQGSITADDKGICRAAKVVAAPFKRTTWLA
jgi:uncharacterized phiE125 gp8 family phage protein